MQYLILLPCSRMFLPKNSSKYLQRVEHSKKLKTKKTSKQKINQCPLCKIFFLYRAYLVLISHLFISKGLLNLCFKLLMLKVVFTF